MRTRGSVGVPPLLLRHRILVPSSERKRSGGSRAYTFAEAQAERTQNRFSSLTQARQKALQVFLHAVNGAGHAASVLRLKGRVLQQATAVNLEFQKGPLMGVLEREHGPLFMALDAASLDTAAARRLRNDLVVVCPLLGLLASTDHVPEYRCAVGAQIPEFGSLHAWWKPHLSVALDRLCRGRRVYTFLPARLQALWPQSGSAAEMVYVVFGRVNAAGRVQSDHAASQRLAGELVRVILSSAHTAPEDLANFKSSAGHVLRPDLCKTLGRDRTLVFVR
ncbi:MAG: peroxide stress protein YaaA [Planctomycetes bacterium]|nr:peroxide stress protein YaaA [Planctomycetota bacterium]